MNRDEENGIIRHIHLEYMVKQLPIKQQVVVALQAAGYTQLESGDILGVTGAAIGFSFKRAVALLRQDTDGIQ